MFIWNQYYMFCYFYLILHSLLCLLLLFEHNEFTQLILNFLLGIDFLPNIFYLVYFNEFTLVISLLFQTNELVYSDLLLLLFQSNKLPHLNDPFWCTTNILMTTLRYIWIALHYYKQMSFYIWYPLYCSNNMNCHIWFTLLIISNKWITSSDLLFIITIKLVSTSDIHFISQIRWITTSDLFS